MSACSIPKLHINAFVAKLRLAKVLCVLLKINYPLKMVVVTDAIIPRLIFFKKRMGYCYASVRPSIRQSIRLSVMLYPPKPLEEIHPNLMCELFT